MNGKRQPDKTRGLPAHETLMTVTIQVWLWSIGTINSCCLMAMSSWKWVIRLSPSPTGQLQMPSILALGNSLIYSQGTDSKDRRGHGGMVHETREYWKGGGLKSTINWGNVGRATYAWLPGVSCQPSPRLPQLRTEWEPRKLEDPFEYVSGFQWSSESLLGTTSAMKVFLSPCISESQPLTCSRPALLAGTPTSSSPSLLISSVGCLQFLRENGLFQPLGSNVRSHKLGVIWISERDLDSNTTPFPHQKKILVLFINSLIFLDFYCTW